MLTLHLVDDEDELLAYDVDELEIVDEIDEMGAVSILIEHIIGILDDDEVVV